MAQETRNTEFGERMSVEQFVEKTQGKYFKVYPRTKTDENGKQVIDPATKKPARVYGHTDGVEDKSKPLYYFATANMLGYVPSALGQKMENKEPLGELFITEAVTEGYETPMYMLCESKRETVWELNFD
jgi:hypothetical protein